MHWVGSYHKMGRVNTLPKDNRFITIQGILQVCSSVNGVQAGFTRVYRGMQRFKRYTRVCKGLQRYTRVY